MNARVALIGTTALFLVLAFQNCGAPMSQSMTSSNSSQNRNLASNGMCYPAELCEPNLQNLKILSNPEIPLTPVGPLTNISYFNGELAGQCDTGEFDQHKIIVRWSLDNYDYMNSGMPNDEIKCDPEGKFYLLKRFDFAFARTAQVLYAELSMEVSDPQLGTRPSLNRTVVRFVYPLSGR